MGSHNLSAPSHMGEHWDSSIEIIDNLETVLYISSDIRFTENLPGWGDATNFVV
jgi:hypothetical protein